MIDCESERPNAFPQVLRVREHTFRADLTAKSGSTDSAPGPHDYFDAALASCKALTANLAARKYGIALERVEVHVERDDSEERSGKYRLKVRMAFHGAMTDEDRSRLYAAVERCPIHKLMTTADITIDSGPMDK
jgi:putative redox protein